MNNSMIDSEKCQKDLVIQAYERIVVSEKESYNEMATQSRLTGNRVSLEPGTAVNECSLLLDHTYLRGYKLTYDVEEPPVIASLSSEAFKECLVQTDTDQIEKIINFSKQIPGF